MHLNLVRTAAKTAAVGGVAALGFAALQAAAQASPHPVVKVPCDVTTLNTVITDATAGATISLAPGCMYILPAALPSITKQLTITGHNSSLQRSFATATPAFTILTVSATGNLTVNNVNFYNGGGYTTAIGDGGAIYNDTGTLTVNGGNYRGNGNVEYGGAIDNDGTMTVTGATFTGNDAYYGGDIYNNGTTVKIVGSQFNNSAATGGYGGGIYNDQTMTVTNSHFVGDVGLDQGGGIYSEGVMTVNSSSFQRNDSSDGGGIYDEDTATINQSQFVDNQADDGGGLNVGYLATVKGGNFSHNVAIDGAGIYDDDMMTVQYANVYANEASSNGGGVYISKGSTLSIRGGSIHANSAPGGGGGLFNSAGTVTLTNAGIYNNSPDNCEPLGTIIGCHS
jgi:hypothetical protein